MAAEEKKVTGIDAMEAGYVEVPEISPIEQIEADSMMVSPAELEEEMRGAGLQVAETPAKEAVPVEETAIGLEEESFAETPELTPIEQLEADEFVVSPAEVAEDMRAAGLEMAEKAQKEPLPVEETAIGLEEASFNEMPELSPIEQLEVDEFVASPAEIEEDRKEAGVE